MTKAFFAALVLSLSLVACGGGAGSGLTPGVNSTQASNGTGGTKSLPTAAPAPSAAPLAVCAAIALPVATGSGAAASSTTCAVSETSYTGTFTVADGGTCAGIVTFAPTVLVGPSASFTVTQVGGGACTLVVSDANGQRVTINVGSTWTTGTLSYVNLKPEVPA